MYKELIYEDAACGAYKVKEIIPFNADGTYTTSYRVVYTIGIISTNNFINIEYLTIQDRVDISREYRDALGTLLDSVELINHVTNEIIKNKNGESSLFSESYDILSFAKYIKACNDINIDYIKRSLECFCVEKNE